jgi:serine O-acetyltransferase
MKKLAEFIEALHKRSLEDNSELPNKPDVNRFVNEGIELLFPMDKPRSLDAYHLRFNGLSLQLERLLCVLKAGMKHEPTYVIDRFFANLPGIYSQLLEDAEAIFRFDPAAESIREVVNAYPGFFAIAAYRMSHCLLNLGVPLLPRMMSEYAHSVTGIDINPGARIGNSFFIDHGTGVVIGETTDIGNHVKIYQGVTLGALSVEKSLASTKRHPTIEDNVVIYAGSTVLGGKTVVGHDSVIGGNVWLTNSVPPFSVVYHNSEVKIRNNKNFQEPINFSI